MDVASPSYLREETLVARHPDIDASVNIPLYRVLPWAVRSGLAEYLNCCRGRDHWRRWRRLLWRFAETAR